MVLKNLKTLARKKKTQNIFECYKNQVEVIESSGGEMGTHPSLFKYNKIYSALN